jgi:hypothetical protein
MDQISIICTVLYNYKQLDIDGKIEVKDFRVKKGGLCADVTSFFPHDSHTTLTRDHLQAS